MKTVIVSAIFLPVLLLFFSCPAAQLPGGPLVPPYSGVTVYTASSGNDANDGLSQTTPKQSLSAALALAKLSNAQYLLVSGNYDLTAGTSNAGFYIGQTSNLIISGGWNSIFTAQFSVSVLNGNSVCGHVVAIEQGYSITLTNFALTGGSGSGDYGGGLVCYQSRSVSLFCTISNNIQASGGGVSIFDSDSNTISGNIMNNTASTGSGGGVYVVNSFFNTINCTITGNAAKYCGGIYLSSSHSNSISGILSNNNSTGGSAGGFRTDFSVGNTVSAVIRNNNATGHGGGIFFYNSTNNTIAASSVIQYNHCDNDDNATGTGGSVHDMGGSGNTIQLGAVYSPNFLGSASTNTNDLVGIAAP